MTILSSGGSCSRSDWFDMTPDEVKGLEAATRHVNERRTKTKPKKK